MGRFSGPGRAGPISKLGRAESGRAETFENVMGQAGPGRDV